MTTPRPSIADKRSTFRKLHETGCFVIPNPWDVGSALYLQSLGFKALATTSSGFAWSQGHADNGISRDMALAHLHAMVAATDLPVNADFESGFATDAPGVGRERAPCGRDRSGGAVDRGLDRRRARARFSISPSLSIVSAQRARPSTRLAATRFSWDARNAFSSADRISTKRSEGSRLMRTQAPIAFMRQASRRAIRSPPSWPRSRRSPSICSSARRAS